MKQGRRVPPPSHPPKNSLGKRYPPRDILGGSLGGVPICPPQARFFLTRRYPPREIPPKRYPPKDILRGVARGGYVSLGGYAATLVGSAAGENFCSCQKETPKKVSIP